MSGARIEDLVVVTDGKFNGQLGLIKRRSDDAGATTLTVDVGTSVVQLGRNQFRPYN